MTDNEQPLIAPEEEASDDEFRAAIDAALAAAEVEPDDAPVTAGDNVTEADSLQGNEFAVELDGEPVKGIFRVSGLVSFSVTDRAETAKITLAKMVQRDVTMPFNQWIKATIEAGSSPARALAIVAIDDGVETRRWTLTDAQITQISYSDFDTGSSDFVEEVISLTYGQLVETWTWSDAQ